MLMGALDGAQVYLLASQCLHPQGDTLRAAAELYIMFVTEGDTGSRPNTPNAGCKLGGWEEIQRVSAQSI